MRNERREYNYLGREKIFFSSSFHHLHHASTKTVLTNKQRETNLVIAVVKVFFFFVPLTCITQVPKQYKEREKKERQRY